LLQNKDGYIDGQELRDVCHQLNVPIEDEMLSLLMSYCCTTSEDGAEREDELKTTKIDYVKFANFLNWKDKMPIAAEEKST